MSAGGGGTSPGTLFVTDTLDDALAEVVALCAIFPTPLSQTA